MSWGVDLASEHERYLTEEVFNAPAIVYNYPKGIKAFYMRLNDDDKTVAAMDVLVPKIGELIGGSQREERLDVRLAAVAALYICIHAILYACLHELPWSWIWSEGCMRSCQLVFRPAGMVSDHTSAGPLHKLHGCADVAAVKDCMSLVQSWQLTGSALRGQRQV